MPVSFKISLSESLDPKLSFLFDPCEDEPLPDFLINTLDDPGGGLSGCDESFDGDTANVVKFFFSSINLMITYVYFNFESKSTI